MVLWIGVDDTDSLRGMCTTFLATELVHDLTRAYDLIGYPRLVRLNPNVPWKTRGNGAVCIRLARGRGTPAVIGNVRGREILAYPRGEGTCDADEVTGIVGRAVEAWSCFDDPTTHPAFVVLERPPTARLYWRAVREIVGIAEAERAVRDRGTVRRYKSGRGLIGAAAATAWRPRDRTYEVLAYRRRGLWGRPRVVEPGSVIAMDGAFPATFNNYDYEERRVVIAPHSPCPVLFGIRGDRPDDLPQAMRTILGETPERWLLFETNQGTDDHVIPGPALRPRTTVRVAGTVVAGPRTLPGGHVVFSTEAFEATAYEPSKGFRRVMLRLVPGDRVTVVGAVREEPRTLNLEKLRVDALASVLRKRANPLCPRCGKRTKSSGRDRPYRCPRCRTRVPRSQAARVLVERGLRAGWYEPPVGSRRHLSKPLRRGAPAGTGEIAIPDVQPRNARPPRRGARVVGVPSPGMRLRTSR